MLPLTAPLASLSLRATMAMAAWSPLLRRAQSEGRTSHLLLLHLSSPIFLLQNSRMTWTLTRRMLFCQLRVLRFHCMRLLLLVRGARISWKSGRLRL